MSGYQGIRWFKCDLHVHTPEDGKNWDCNDPLTLGNPRRPKVDGKPDESDIQGKALRFLRRCHELELEVIAITDHNFSGLREPRDWFLTHLIEQNPIAAREPGRAPLWIFPGFEIDIGYPLICLFDPLTKTGQLAKVNEALITLGLAVDGRFEGSQPCTLRHDQQYVSLRTVLQKVQNECGGIVIAAHAFSDDGIASESRDADDYLNEELLCVEVAKSPLEGRAKDILEASQGRWRREHRPSAYIMSSDGKSTLEDEKDSPKSNGLGCRYSWIKMSRPSIESLRQAFLDPRSRVRLQHGSPEKDERHSRIVSLSVRDAAFLDDQTVEFSPNLNCLIGGRGTGKSTLLEYLRMAVRQEDEPLAEEQVRRVKKTLTPSSCVTVEWRDGSGVTDRFEYTPALAKAQVVGRDVSAPAIIFGKLGIQIFSQDQISRLTALDSFGQPAFLLPLIDRLCGHELEELKQREAELMDRVLQQQQQQHLLERLMAEGKTLEQELIELERRWTAHAAVQEEATRHRYAQEAERHLQRVLQDAERIQIDWSERANTVIEEHSPIGSALDNWPCPDYFARLDAEIEKAKELLSQEVCAAVERFRTNVCGLTEQSAEYGEVVQAIRKAEEAFTEACVRHGLQPEDLGRLREIETQRRSKTRELEAKRAEITQTTNALGNLDSLRQELCEVWRQQWATRGHQLEKVVSSEGILQVPREPEKAYGARRSFIEASIEYCADKGHFVDLWGQLSPDRRTSLGKHWDEIGDVVFDRCFSVSQSQWASPWEVVTTWMENPQSIPSSLQSHAADMSDHLCIHSREGWERSRLTRIRDSIDLRLYRKDGTYAGSLQAGGLSDGQRNTAVLSLLLAEGTGPVIIDQPEDELDSDFIFHELVPLLRHTKEHRQIILVTHNANLPVNGDAELVYALNTREGHGVARAQGGIDREEVKEAVLDIMEGSEEAFRRRREKYHF